MTGRWRLGRRLTRQGERRIAAALGLSGRSRGPLADASAAAEVRRLLVESSASPDPEQLSAAYVSAAGRQAPARMLSGLRDVRAELLGAGPLQQVLDDEAVSDVLVHGGGEVWVDAGEGARRSELRLGGDGIDGETATRALATRLVASGGRRLDAAQPYADVTLRSGHRLHAVIPPVAVDGTCLSIRTLRPARFDIAGLVAAGLLESQVAELLTGLVANGCSVLVSGRTGSGKTTLVAALLATIPPAQRVIIIEDTSELRPSHPHSIRLQSRPPNVEGAGAVSLRDLVRQALRMRPDRIVLGEVRGAEIVDLLVAMNTGHRGGLCTIHANGIADVPARIEALGLLAGVSRDAIHALLTTAFEVVVHLDDSSGRRQVVEVGVLRGEPGGRVAVTSALRVVNDVVEVGPLYPDLLRWAGRPDGRR